MAKLLRWGDCSDQNLFFTDARLPGSGYQRYAIFPIECLQDQTSDGASMINTSVPESGETPFDQGKITVHEISHWLGLFHTFEGCCVIGDRVKVISLKNCHANSFFWKFIEHNSYTRMVIVGGMNLFFSCVRSSLFLSHSMRFIAGSISFILCSFVCCTKKGYSGGANRNWWKSGTGSCYCFHIVES